MCIRHFGGRAALPWKSDYDNAMRIENDVKLDFSDVLIRPKRSTLTSRKSVELERSFTFMHSGRHWTGVPIAAANMDTTGTFDMARALFTF